MHYDHAGFCWWNSLPFVFMKVNKQRLKLFAVSVIFFLVQVRILVLKVSLKLLVVISRTNFDQHQSIRNFFCMLKVPITSLLNKSDIKPYQSNVHFLHPLKTKNSLFFDIFKEDKKGTLTWIGLTWVLSIKCFLYQV